MTRPVAPYYLLGGMVVLRMYGRPTDVGCRCAPCFGEAGHEALAEFGETLLEIVTVHDGSVHNVGVQFHEEGFGERGHV
jgi:hypothetical protein